jgi:hypothetical protein
VTFTILVDEGNNEDEDHEADDSGNYSASDGRPSSPGAVRAVGAVRDACLQEMLDWSHVGECKLLD